MIYVVATVHIKPGCKTAFLEEFLAIVPTVQEEQGCRQYVPTIDVNMELPPQVLDENSVTILEKWDSEAALRAHLVAPHMTEYREKVKDLVASTSLSVLQEAG